MKRSAGFGSQCCAVGLCHHRWKSIRW